MFVFRVENIENGTGPLAGTDFFTAFMLSRCFIAHKAPKHFRDEGFDFDFTSSHIFGWTTMELMKRFFNPKFKKNLHNTNYVVSVYQIADEEETNVIFPDGQIAFIRSKSKFVESINVRNINMVKKYDKPLINS